jgi:hypothetical protein
MPEIAGASGERNSEAAQTEFLLSSLRVASLRARLAATELDSVGVALKGGIVAHDDAVAWLRDLDLLDHVIHRPGHDECAAA